ncbi:MAG: aminotransferase class III-fold pyridoxal phosphate-dependent enzyme [Methanobacteriota archaeon]|nr:MAG: aminotransferase class III-fold pyridoxal phosphate-dependent enzyme [Euryarchaeota archaeon]
MSAVDARAVEFACSPKRAPTFVRGSVATLWDDEGTEYIDCGASFGVGNLGHCHPAIVDAITAQTRELIHVGPTFGTDAKSAFTERLLSVAPRNLRRVFLSNSGSEAVEAAIKFARAATGDDGRAERDVAAGVPGGVRAPRPRVRACTVQRRRGPPGEGRARDRRGDPRGRAGGGRGPRRVPRVPAGRAGDLRRRRRAPDPGRGPDRDGPDGPDVRRGAVGRRARHRHPREIPRGRRPDRRDPRDGGR